MILVVLAMSIRRPPLWSNSTCPVSASISTAAEALVDTPHTRTGVRHHHSASPTSSHVRFLNEITPNPSVMTPSYSLRTSLLPLSSCR